jgi:hypothetical protein
VTDAAKDAASKRSRSSASTDDIKGLNPGTATNEKYPKHGAVPQEPSGRHVRVEWVCKTTKKHKHSKLCPTDLKVDVLIDFHGNVRLTE